MLKFELKNIHKSFKNNEILRGVSFSAQKGDVIAVLGSSGSGKSTLLRCINLLVTPDAGSMQFEHKTIHFHENKPIVLSHKQLVQLRKKVGMVFQNFNLWAHMTLLENLIAAPIYVLKQKRDSAIAAAKTLLDKVGLSDKIQHYPAELSGGQQQRAAIARALMMKPEIMLFDEPTSALDPEMVAEVLVVMQQLAAEGMTMLIATHELEFARRVANQTIFLDTGKIIEEGQTKTLFAHPKTERFKKFLAAMQQGL